MENKGNVLNAHGRKGERMSNKGVVEVSPGKWWKLYRSPNGKFAIGSGLPWRTFRIGFAISNVREIYLSIGTVEVYYSWGTYSADEIDGTTSPTGGKDG